MKQYKHIFKLLVFVLSLVLLNCGDEDGNGGGNSQADLPAVPENFKAVVSSGQVTLTWTMQDDVAYQLYYSTTAEIIVSSDRVTNIQNVNSPHTFTGLTNGTTYHYRLTASSSSGLSRPTNEVSATPLAAPENFTAAGLTDRIRLSWTAQDQEGITYDLFYSTAPGVDVESADVTKISVGTLPYDHLGVVGGTTYYYRLKAKAPLGASDLTEEISAASGLPSKPRNFAAVALSQRVTLTWDRQEGVAGYDLFYATTPGFDVNDMDSGTVMKITGVNPPYVQRELTNDTTYYYRLTAVNPAGVSDPADEISATPQEVQHISAGNSNTCAVVGGAVLCWGSDPNRITSVQSTDLTTGVGVTQIAVGSSHICAVVNGGVRGGAFCWGRGSFGQLGNGANSDTNAPAQVIDGMGTEISGVTKISTGLDHSCAVVGGGAFCWGRGSFGRLGNRSNSNASTPQQVNGLTSEVTQISVGGSHSCAVARGGAWCWGRGVSGQLGNDSTPTSANAPVQVRIVTNPGLPAIGMNPAVERTLMPLSGVTEISAGGLHTCAVVDGKALCWGNGRRAGQLGTGRRVGSSTAVQVIGLTANVTKISAGLYHTCAVMDGGAWCWGYGGHNRLGNGGLGSLNPQPVIGATSGVTQISAGREHTCAVVNGRAKCWGSVELD